jgi:hypothetical protein
MSGDFIEIVESDGSRTVLRLSQIESVNLFPGTKTVPARLSVNCVYRKYRLTFHFDTAVELARCYTEIKSKLNEQR